MSAEARRGEDGPGRPAPALCFCEDSLPPLKPLPRGIVAALLKGTNNGSPSTGDGSRREDGTEITESLAASPERV